MARLTRADGQTLIEGDPKKFIGAVLVGISAAAAFLGNEQIATMVIKIGKWLKAIPADWGMDGKG